MNRQSKKRFWAGMAMMILLLTFAIGLPLAALTNEWNRIIIWGSWLMAAAVAIFMVKPPEWLIEWADK